MKVRFKNSYLSQFYKLFCMFILLIFFANLVLIAYTIQDYRKRTNQENASYLESVSERIDRDMNVEIKTVVNSFMDNINYLHYINLKHSQDKNQSLFKLQAVLQQLRYGHEDIYSDCAMYYTSSDELISAERGYFQLSRDANASYRVLYDIDAVANTPQGISILTTTQENSISARLVHRFTEDAAIILLLNESYITNLFYRDFNSLSDSGILIVDSQGTTIYQNGILPAGWDKSAPPVLPILEGLPGNTEFRDSDNASYLCGCAYIPSLKLTILRYQRETTIAMLRTYSHILYVFGAVVLILIVSGCMITYLYSKNCYIPFGKILNRILESDPSASRIQPQNEFELLDHYVTSSQHKISRMEHMIQSSHLMLKERFLKYLLTNPSPQAADIEEYTTILKLDFPHPYYTCIYCLLDQNTLSAQSYADRNVLLLQLLHQIECNCSSDNALLLGCEYSEQALGIILNTKDQEVLQSAVSSLDSLIRKYLQNNWNIPYILSVGPTIETPELASGFFAAMEQSELHFYLRPEITCCFPRGDAEPVPDPSYQACLLRIQNMPFEPAELANIMQSLRRLFSLEEPNLAACRSLLTAFLQKLIQSVNDHLTSGQDINMEMLLHPTRYFWSADAWFSYLEERLLPDVLAAEDPNEELYLKINRYIDNHFSEPLSLELLGEQFCLHPKYMSKAYKESSGQNITSYINQKRLEKAILLLTETDKNVESIALEVGFSSSGYFIKCFRAKTGTTPKAYREALRQH